MHFDKNRIEFFEDSPLYYIGLMSFYVSKTGESVAIQFETKPAEGQVNPPMKSRRVYIPIGKAEACESPKQLFNLACWHLRPFLAKAQALHWKESLVVQCRAYRTTHKEILAQVGKHLKSYGPTWWENEAARKLALDTLNSFGVKVS